jgi:hypothetical protein
VDNDGGMARDERIIWQTDLSPADWLPARLNDFAVDTGSVVPEGFEAYCRIFHPWSDRIRSRSWASVAEENGRVVHPEMQAHMISRPTGTPAPPYNLNDFINRMEWGSLPFREREILVDVLGGWTAPNETCLFLVWAGYGFFPAAELVDTVHLPGREYLLYTGTMDLALASLDDEDQSPNLWWPESHSWIVATEIDFAWTYVGGPVELVEAICSSGQLEALPAQLSDKPFHDSDRINMMLDAV